MAQPIPGIDLLNTRFNPAGNGTLSLIANKITPDVYHINDPSATAGTGVVNVVVDGETQQISLNSGDFANYSASAFQTALQAHWPHLTATRTNGPIIISSTGNAAFSFSAVAEPNSAFNFSSISHVVAFSSAPGNIRYTAPGDTAGPAELIEEGAIWLTSGNGTSQIEINITLNLLPADDVTTTINIPVSEVINHKDWVFRRRTREGSNNLQLTVVFENGANQTIILGNTSATAWKQVSLNTPSHPVSIDTYVTGTNELANSQDDIIYISFDDSSERLSYARIETVNIYGNTLPATYPVTNNDPPVVRIEREGAIERVRSGSYTGDILDTIRVIVSSDSAAQKAHTMLKAGSNYQELIDAGFSNSESTLLTAIWFTVPSTEQQQQTTLLTKLAAVRDMTAPQLANYLTWADSNGVKIPLQQIKQAIIQPGQYNPTDTASIIAYIDAI